MALGYADLLQAGSIDFRAVSAGEANEDAEELAP